MVNQNSSELRLNKTDSTETIASFLDLHWAASWENLFMPYANNKDADQPAHPRSLICVFVFRCLDSIKYLVYVQFQDFS